MQDMCDTGLDRLEEWEALNKRTYINVVEELVAVFRLFTAMKETWKFGNELVVKAPPFNLKSEKEYEDLSRYFCDVYESIANSRTYIEQQIRAREANLTPMEKEWRAINQKSFCDIKDDIELTQQLFAKENLPWLDISMDMDFLSHSFNTKEEHEDLDRALRNVSVRLSLRKQWFDDRIKLAPLEEEVVQKYEDLKAMYEKIQEKCKKLGCRFEIKNPQLTPPPYFLCTEKMYTEKLAGCKQLHIQFDLCEVAIKEVNDKFHLISLKKTLSGVFKNTDIELMILDKC